MPFKKIELAKLGCIEPHSGEFRAHLRLRDGAGLLKEVRGPNRTTEEQAQTDLEQIRKAAEKSETREEGLEMMRKETQKLKGSGKYEAEIRDTPVHYGKEIR